MFEDGGKAGQASARPGAAALLAMVLVALLDATPAAAQPRPNDVRITSSLDMAYAIDAKWALDVFSETRVDNDVSRLADLVLRPKIQYALTPNWAVAAGYVQIQPLEAVFRAERGPFEDLFYRTTFGSFGVANRLRLNEVFLGDSGALLVNTSYLLAVQHPIGTSVWYAALSDEVFFNLKVDGTGHPAGFHENRAYVGIGRPIDPRLDLSIGYELSAHDARGTFYSANTIKFALAIRLN